MRITVRKVLDLEKMQKCVLVAGEKGLEREILCVDAMEIPEISPWLKKGVLLVTTGYAIKNDVNALIRLIEDLQKVEAAGLAVKTRFIGHLPAPVIQKADELEVPLIVLPEEMPFVEVNNALIEMIVDAQNMRLIFSNSIHEKFMCLELSGGSFEEIGNMLFHLLQRPVLITNSLLKPLVRPSGTESFSCLLQSMEEAGFFHRLSEGDHQLIFLEQESVIARKVYYKDKICGYIFVSDASVDIDDLNRIVLDHAASTVALKFAQEDALRNHMSMLENSLLADLLMNNINSEEQAALRTRQLGWQPPPFGLAVFGLDFINYTQEPGDPWQLKQRRELTQAVQQYLNREKVVCTVIQGGESFVCMVRCDDWNKFQQAAGRIKDKILDVIGVPLTAGLVPLVERYMTLPRAFGEALDAVKIGRAIGKSILCIDEVRLEQAVMHSGENPYLKQFVEKTAEKLIRYDADHNSELVKTAQALARNMGIRTRTAEDLYLHRNTLLRRIRKIESITGLDLSGRQALQDLGLGLRIQPFV